MSAKASRSRSRSPRTRSYKIKMILPRTCEISAEETMSLVDNWGVQRIKLSDLTQETTGDQVLKIIGPSQSVVFNAFTEVRTIQCLGKFAFAQNEWAECRILVTETMASRLPKKKLEEVQDLSQASISLHPIVTGRKEVPLRVSGKLPAVESAFQVLLNTLDEQSETEKLESPAAKFVVPKSTVAELTGVFQTSCKSEFGIDVFFSDSDGPPCSELEAIVVRRK